MIFSYVLYTVINMANIKSRPLATYARFRCVCVCVFEIRQHFPSSDINSVKLMWKALSEGVLFKHNPFLGPK